VLVYLYLIKVILFPRRRTAYVEVILQVRCSSCVMWM